MVAEYEITLDQMEHFTNESGQSGDIGYALEGYRHGLEQISMIWSQTPVGGGPPLHTHGCEEIHVVPSGRVRHVIDGIELESEGPCVIRIPPGAEHTFTAVGGPITVLGFFPYRDLMSHYHVVGPNPLIGDAGVR
jgi:mannose-6-phosphate isomerase-like protein (cupin superfamily)